MIITWYGLSCFLIKTDGNVKILTDPYAPSLSRFPYRGVADIITISHSHIDHSYVNPLCGNAEIIREPMKYDFGSVKITGYMSYHDSVNGIKRGSNIIYVIEADGIRLCHLGDLGHLLSDEEADLLNGMDVLFIPVDANFTLAPKTAFEVAAKLHPKIIIPMHYASAGISFPLSGIEKFITLIKKATAINSNQLELHAPVEESNAVTILRPPV